MFKGLVLSVLLAATAHADTLATSTNSNGGLIVLSDVQCKDGSGMVIYSQSNKAPTLYGCWFSDDLMVHVRWNDGDNRAYPLDMFKLYKKPAKFNS